MRACLQGCLLYYSNSQIDHNTRLGFSIYVILNRFVLGWDAYIYEIKKEFQSGESVREITTSIGIFLEILGNGGVSIEDDKIDLNLDKVISSIENILYDINSIELNKDPYILQNFSIMKMCEWYPNGKVHPIIAKLWS